MQFRNIATLVAAASLGLTLTPTVARAADKDKDKDHGHAKGEHAEGKEKMEMPATAEGIFEAIKKHRDAIAASIESGKLDEVHHHAFAARDLAKGLPAKADADKKVRVEGAVKNVVKLATDLDEAGDAGDKAATEANLKKLDGMIKLLKAQFGIS